MRILKIYDGDYPWDVRVAKMLRSFRERDHQVTLLARNPSGKPTRVQVEGTQVRRLPRTGALEPLLGFPAFFHPAWVASAWRAARS